MKKVLCLHGYTQNGPLFSRKASGVRKALAKIGIESFFLSAPVPVSKDDLKFETEDTSQMLSWWVTQEHDPQYYKLDLTLEYIKDVLEHQGPFAGVLGFSQGAGLAGVLPRLLPKIAPSHPPLEFCILYSGFLLRPDEYQPLYEPKIDTPSLHILGSLDTIVSEERSLALFDRYENAVLVKHPGGHYVPAQKPILEQVLAFAQNLEGDQSSSDSGWDEFDNIGGQNN